MPTTLEPSELRPALHAKVEQLDGEALAILHRVALQLELDQLVGEVDADFDKLRTQGGLDRLPEIIREARAVIRGSTAARSSNESPLNQENAAGVLAFAGRVSAL